MDSEKSKDLSNNREFIAHRRENVVDDNQSLWTHLKETSFLAGRFSDKIGLKEQGELLGLLHDLGKATSEFDQISDQQPD